jgi:hypothetical protein
VIESNEEECDTEQEAESEDECEVQDIDQKRMLFGTNVIFWDDPVLPFMLCSVLQKMFSAPRGVVRLIDNNRPYIHMNSTMWRWAKVTFPSRFEQRILRHNSLPNAEELILLEDFQGGADGRVWRACSKAGLGCVVKFARRKEPTSTSEIKWEEQKLQLDEEANVWKSVHGENSVKVITLVGRPALMMPYAKPVFRPGLDLDDAVKTAVINAVKHLANQGFQHDDLKPRHVGVLSPTKQKNEHKSTGPTAILFDLAQVTPLHSREQKEDAVIKMLNDLHLQ